MMFYPAVAKHLNFWAAMFLAGGILMAYSFVVGKDDLKKVLKYKKKWVWIGLIYSVLLYLVFFEGHYISRLLLDFTDRQVSNIYAAKGQASKIFIGLSLLLWIGPAEEIFWRGFIQNNLAMNYGGAKGFIITALLYAFVHIWAFNFILFMAALICGIVWGWMFLKYKSVVPGIVAHAFWDVMIFIIIPIR